MLNPALILGATQVLVPRFQVQQVIRLIADEGVTMMPLVPPVLNALCLAAETVSSHAIQTALGEIRRGASGS